VEKGGKVVIVNKQRTPKDASASLLIHAPCDTVMQLLLKELGLQL
jgi:NAD-dependent SIR2 family protein deacetylase